MAEKISGKRSGVHLRKGNGIAAALMFAALLLLANCSFVVYDLLLDRLEIFYHVRLRPKLKL